MVEETAPNILISTTPEDRNYTSSNEPSGAAPGQLDTTISVVRSAELAASAVERSIAVQQVSGTTATLEDIWARDMSVIRVLAVHSGEGEGKDTGAYKFAHC
jgi:hypothetical protein